MPWSAACTQALFCQIIQVLRAATEWVQRSQRVLVVPQIVLHTMTAAAHDRYACKYLNCMGGPGRVGMIKIPLLVDRAACIALCSSA